MRWKLRVMAVVAGALCLLVSLAASSRGAYGPVPTVTPSPAPGPRIEGPR